MKPICFKIRGGVEREDGSRGSTHIGKMAGKGYLGSENKSFTVLATQDQYLFAGQGNNQSTYNSTKPPMTTKKLKYLSLFSGIEAASAAWHPLGWEPVGFAEIEPFPSAVLKHRFPNTKNYGDITKWKEWNLTPGSVDIVCAGSPCQAFSVAGLRKGLDDPRGNLALVTLGLVEHLQPKWFIWENVPGVLTSNGGRDFAALLTALGNIGYGGWAYRILDAQHFGVPQRRRRVWLVATRGSANWPLAAAVLFDSESLRWNPQKGIKARKRVAGSPASSVGGVGSEVTAYGSKSQPGVANTLETTCHDYSRADGFNMVTEPVAFRKSTRAQSSEHPETWVDDGKANTLNVHDQGDVHTTHAVVEPVNPQGVDLYNQTVTGDIHVPLRTAGGHGAPAALVQHQAFTVREDSKANTFHAKPVDVALCVNALQPSPQSQHAQNFVVHCADTAPTVTQSGPPFSRTGNSRVESEAMVVTGEEPITFQPGNLRRDAGAEPSTDATTTLKASSGDQMPHVAYSFRPNGIRIGDGIKLGEVAGTVMANSKSGDAETHILNCDTTMAVRRLTPTECLRLQGFPDGWTQIPWKGKPASECPDGPQYKAIGNSWAVPCARWIGERIAEVEEITNGEA